MKSVNWKNILNLIGLPILVLITSFGGNVWAADYYVSVSGDNANNGSAASPWKTITHALELDSVTSGDTVHVSAGTYSAAATGESFPISMKKGVNIIGDNRDSTVLDAANAAAVIAAKEVDGVTLSGFTITNGNASQGGGIFCADSSMNIKGNIIKNNKADSGGGIYANSKCTILNNEISKNSANAGAGVYVTGENVSVTSNKITGNQANRYGGGLYIADLKSGSINRNLILNNQASKGSGGGVYIVKSSGNINNNLIAKNSADSVGGVYASDIDKSSKIINNTIADNTGNSPNSVGGMQASDVEGVFKNNIFWNNSSTDFFGGLVVSSEGGGATTEGTVNISYSIIKNYASANNNIYSDPKFAGANDYHLGAGSPAIDAGTSDGAPSVDIEGVARPNGTGVDMGAYEYISVSGGH